MAAKSQSRLQAKGSKTGTSKEALSSKSDVRSAKKRVTMEDDNGEDKDAMAFKVLSSEHTNELMSLPVLQIQSRLKEIFNLENNEIDLKEAAILDYYTSAVYWGIQQKFTAQQLSGFFSVIHVLLDNVKEKHMTMVDNVNELKKLFVGIGLDDVKAAGLDFFNVQQTKLITEYIYTSFFQHYNLYSFMFSHSQAEEIIGTDLTIEVAKSADVPFPPPLDEGVTEEMHSLYIATPPPTPSPEPEEEKPDPTKELEETVTQSDLFSQLTPEDVREVVESVTKEMLGNLQSEVATKLRDKESLIIQRINKIHKVAE